MATVAMRQSRIHERRKKLGSHGAVCAKARDTNELACLRIKSKSLDLGQRLSGEERIES